VKNDPLVTYLQDHLAGALHAIELLKAMCQHQLRPVIDSTFPLEEAEEAFRRMESARHVGKIVVTC